VESLSHLISDPNVSVGSFVSPPHHIQIVDHLKTTNGIGFLPTPDFLFGRFIRRFFCRVIKKSLDESLFSPKMHLEIDISICRGTWTEVNMNPATGAPPEQFLPLSLSVFHILLSLCDQERHGYGIMKEVRARTDGEVRLAPGLLYGT
jgi:hypothetical protein